MNERYDAVPVTYDGIAFRSVTEARWAVFFSALRIPYQYEKPILSPFGDVIYRPDFYIPRFDTYFEVKPRSYEVVKHEIFKPLVFASYHKIALCYGPPAQGSIIPLGSFAPNECGGPEYGVFPYQDVMQMMAEDATNRFSFLRDRRKLGFWIGTTDDRSWLYFPLDKGEMIHWDRDPLPCEVIEEAVRKSEEAVFSEVQA
jgi:hypothetical protein